MIQTASYTRQGLDYAELVVAGKYQASKWTRLACERQLRDLDRWRGRDSEYQFSEERAERICEFVAAMPHVKGRWARDRRTIALESWQAFLLASVFGWIRPDGRRRFRTAFNLIPRKNAKSTLTSAVSLYMLTMDGEEGAEVYSAATNYDQAALVWKDARQMLERSPELRAAVGAGDNSEAIYIEGTNSRFTPLCAIPSGSPGKLDGLNPSFAVLDEVHAMKNRLLYDALDTGMGARSQPLLWLISTAGGDLAGICYEQQQYVQKILEGVLVDETYFGMVYTIDPTDDWQDPDVWQKANPNFGISVDPDDLARQAARAKNLPSLEAAFLTKRLNVWSNADSAWLDMNAYHACGDPALKLEQFVGQAAYYGLDLASRTDILALTLLFPQPDGKVVSFGRYYLPEETIERSENSQYEGWAKMGRLIPIEGAINDWEIVADDLVELTRRHPVRKICFDPAMATQLQVILQKRGISGSQMVDVRQVVTVMSPAMKELEAYIVAGRWLHDACPVTTWMFSNVVCHRDAKDNIYPRKLRLEQKIDGPVSAMIGLTQLLADNSRGYRYREKGIRTI